MPKATTFDDDMSFDAPARKRTPRKPRPSAASKRKGKSKRPRIPLTTVARVAGIGMTVAVGGGIIVNALMMQKGRHPAPLFGRQVVLADVTPPVPPPKPAHLAATPPSEMNAPSAVTPVTPSKGRHDAEPHHETDEAADGGDPIGALLRTGATSPVSDHADPRTVLGAQHALVKLGFVIKPNGTFGPSTRKAIQSFEKERHLPVKGELSRRLVKILSAESGVRID